LNTGRGIKGKEHFHILDSLATQLNAALGASRAACDAQYCSSDLQIGQTGKTIAPVCWCFIENPQLPDFIYLDSLHWLRYIWGCSASRRHERQQGFLIFIIDFELDKNLVIGDCGYQQRPRSPLF
jgi:hypothetical protein